MRAPRPSADRRPDDRPDDGAVEDRDVRGGAAPAVATVALPGGRVLTVRPVTADDEAAVGRLYADLSERDRLVRFFSPFGLTGKALHRWVHPEGSGAVRLVAVTEDGSIVGDVGYFPLDGDPAEAELDITVAEAERGWLGPYLLDLLVDEAARHGMRSLRAIVMFDNHQMRSLVRARGYVALPMDDPSLLCVAIGVDHHVPPWGRHGRPRLLVEAASASWRGAHAASAAGLDVVVCPMAEADIHPSGRAGCPVRLGQPCPLADGADAVIVAFAPESETGARLLAAHDARRAPPLICSPSALPPASSGSGGRRLLLDRDDQVAAGQIVEAIRSDAGRSDAGRSEAGRVATS